MIFGNSTSMCLPKMQSCAGLVVNLTTCPGEESRERNAKKLYSLKVSEAFDIFQDDEDLTYDDHIKSNADDAKRFKKGAFDNYRKLYNAILSQDGE